MTVIPVWFIRGHDLYCHLNEPLEYFVIVVGIVSLFGVSLLIGPDKHQPNQTNLNNKIKLTEINKIKLGVQFNIYAVLKCRNVLFTEH